VNGSAFISIVVKMDILKQESEDVIKNPRDKTDLGAVIFVLVTFLIKKG
jgi:hypothetical protein